MTGIGSQTLEKIPGKSFFTIARLRENGRKTKRKELIITGNKEGLLHFARILITMAYHDNYIDGFHIHLTSEGKDFDSAGTEDEIEEITLWNPSDVGE